MKKRPVFLGVLLAFGLAFAGCPTDDKGGDGNNDGPVYLGDTLELSGQVYLEKQNDDYTISYQPFNGNRTIFNDYGGSGEIKDGKLTFSIGTPNELLALGALFDNDNVQVSNANIRGLSFVSLYVDSNNYGRLRKENQTISVRGGNSYSGTLEYVYYFYVENDVTVNGTGKTETETDIWEGATYTYTTTQKNFNLALKAGWNAVYLKREAVSTFTGTIDNPTGENITETITTSLGNPSLKWVLFDSNDYSATLDRRPLLNAPAIK